MKGTEMLATMSDAHREWHLNSGVPMGTPGCPQDACHPIYDYDEETDTYSRPDDSPAALVKCGLCKFFTTVDHVREHYSAKYAV
jgi:hypothetical protein